MHFWHGKDGKKIMYENSGLFNKHKSRAQTLGDIAMEICCEGIAVSWGSTEMSPYFFHQVLYSVGMVKIRSSYT